MMEVSSTTSSSSSSSSSSKLISNHVYSVLLKRLVAGCLVVVSVSCLLWGLASLFSQFTTHFSSLSTSSSTSLSNLSHSSDIWKVFAHIALSSIVLSLFTVVGITADKSHAGGLGIFHASLAVILSQLTFSLIAGSVIALTLRSLMGSSALEGVEFLKVTLPILSLTFILNTLLRSTSHHETIAATCSVYSTSFHIIVHGLKSAVYHFLWIVLLFAVEKVIEKILCMVPLNGQSYAGYLFRLWNEVVFTNVAFSETLVVGVLTSFMAAISLQVFSRLLLQPIDFSKLNNKGKRTKNEEETLIATLRIMQAPLTPVASNSNDNLPLYAQKLDQSIFLSDQAFARLQNSTAVIPLNTYYGLGLSDSIGSLPTFFGLDSFNMEIYLGLLSRSLAFHDLNRLVRSNPNRRKILFKGQWENVLDSSLHMLMECAAQIQAINCYIREPATIKKSSPQTVSETIVAPKIEREPITVAELQALRLRLGGKSDAGTRKMQVDIQNDGPTSGQTLVTVLEGVWDDYVTPLITDFILNLQGFPLRGELGNEQTCLPPHIAEFFNKLFSPMMSQAVVNGIESLALLLEMALKEDQQGNTFHCVPAVLYVLLRLDSAVDKYTNILQQSYTARVANARGVQYIRYRIHSNQFLPSEVVSVRYACKESIVRLLRNYSDLVVVGMFPNEFSQQLKGFMSQL